MSIQPHNATVKSAGNGDVTSTTAHPNQPKAASAVPETGTEVTEGALDNTNMGDQGAKAAQDINAGKDGDGSPAASREQASVAGKVGDSNTDEPSLGKPHASEPAGHPENRGLKNEATMGNDKTRDGNARSRQESNASDPADPANTHPNKRVVRQGGPLHDPEDNSGVAPNGEKMPRIYDRSVVKALKDGERFFAVFAHDPQSDEGRHVTDRINDLRSGKLSRHDIPQGYWQSDYKSRPPIARKEGGGYVMEG